MGSRQLGLLMLLVKLNILGVRRVSLSYTSSLINPLQAAPPCSIALAQLSLAREFLQFVPKAKYPGETWERV